MIEEQAWDKVTDLPTDITTHHIWRGGLLAIKYSNENLTYRDIMNRITSWNHCDDLTSDEIILRNMLQREVDSFNAMWES